MQVRSLDNEIEFKSIIAVLNYYLYILKSEIQEKYYIGISSNIERRLEFHNTIEKGFTSRYRPWKIMYKKEFGSKEEAIKYENKIKRWKSKAMIEKLIKGEIEL